MNYKNIGGNAQEKTRILRRLWEVELFDGDPEDPLCDTKIETVVAFNHVDALRQAGGHAVEQPKFISYVTWPRIDEAEKLIYRIDNTTDGPYGDPVECTVEIAGQDPWDF